MSGISKLTKKGANAPFYYSFSKLISDNSVLKQKKNLSIGVLLVLHFHAESQLKYSQTSQSSLLNNPANTGRFNKDYRIGVTSRIEKNQLNDLQERAFFFADFKVLQRLVAENDCFGVGILGSSEKITVDGIKNSQLALSLGYHKALDAEGKQMLSVGFQTSFIQRILRKPSLVFESQLEAWQNSGYRNVNIFEIADVQFSYIDVDVGVIWQGKINESCFFLAGAAVNHVTSPKKAFVGGEFLLHRQFTLNFSLEKKFLDESTMFISALARNYNQSSNDFIAGFDYSRKVKKFSSLNLGVWLKNSGNRGFFLTPTIGLSFANIQFNFSYDINLSQKTTSLRSSTEASILYTKALQRNRFLEDRFVRF